MNLTRSGLAVALTSLLLLQCGESPTSENPGDGAGGAQGQSGMPGAGGSLAGSSNQAGSPNVAGSSSQAGSPAQAGSSGSPSQGGATGSCENPVRQPSESSVPAPVSEAVFTAEFAALACAAMAPCCSKAAVSYDAIRCEAYAVAQLDTTLTFDAVAAGLCLDDLVQAAESCAGALDRQGLPYECALAYRGPLALGELCESSSECASDPRGLVECDFNLGGICAIEIRGEPGEACHRSCEQGTAFDQCYLDAEPEDPAVSVACHREDGLTCTETGCAPVKGLGCECILGGEYCTLATRCAGAPEYACVPPIAVGEPCDYDHCADGSICAGGVCTERKHHGEPCEEHEECLGLCALYFCGLDSGRSRVFFDPGYCGG